MFKVLLCLALLVAIAAADRCDVPSVHGTVCNIRSPYLLASQNNQIVGDGLASTLSYVANLKQSPRTECLKAYAHYICSEGYAAPKCSDDLQQGIPLPICKDVCTNYVDECGEYFTNLFGFSLPDCESAAFGNEDDGCSSQGASISQFFQKDALRGRTNIPQ